MTPRRRLIIEITGAQGWLILIALGLVAFWAVIVWLIVR